MEYVIIAFRSRGHTVKFSEFLRNRGVGVEIVNTPKEAGVGCGLSVKVSKNNLAFARRCLSLTALDSYAGTFLISNMSGKRTVRII